MKLLAIYALLATAAAAQAPPPHPVFDTDAVHEIHLRFAQPDFWEQLTANYSGTESDNPYISASLEWGDYKFDSVGVRFKGNSSYTGATTQKKPFRIKLNEFVKGQKIVGMASFNLSNGWNDPSFVREKPYYELAAAAGLNSPRSNFAALYINDRYWGLYILGEVVNGDFLTNYFGKGQDAGNLYKGNIGASFEYLGEDSTPYKAVWEKQTNEDADDWSDLIALTRTLNQTSVDDLQAKLDSMMDVDSVLTALALDNLTVNLDSYVGMGQNFNIYLRPSDNRWVWIPWDPSLAFGGLSQGLTLQQMKELSLEWVTTGLGGFPGGGLPGGPPPGGPPPGGGFPGPRPGGGGPGPGANAGTARPLATKLWQVPAYEARYRQIYQSLVDKVFFADSVVARMNVLRDLIRPWVEKDTQKLVTMQQFEDAMTVQSTVTGTGQPGGPGGLGGAQPALQPFIEDRLASVKSQLAAK